MGDEIARLIEDDIAESPTDDDAESAPHEKIIDRAAIELDAIDARLEAEGELPEEDPPMDARAYSRGALVVAISIWLPYFYWVYVVWRGDYTKVSLHPWIEACAVALIVWYLARREANSAPVEEA